jgi:hypothetical protein
MEPAKPTASEITLEPACEPGTPVRLGIKLDAADTRTFTDRPFHAKDPSRAWRQIELSWLKEIQRELLCSSNSVLASFRLVGVQAL